MKISGVAIIVNRRSSNGINYGVLMRLIERAKRAVAMTSPSTEKWRPPPLNAEPDGKISTAQHHDQLFAIVGGAQWRRYALA